MASFVLDEFVGNGVLKDQIDSLMADGWNDVPTFKMMNKDDMDTLKLSQLQRDALEIRTYLHDRLLMEYADALEASGKNLQELLSTSPTELTTEFKMRRGHVARFLDRSSSACQAVQMPKHLVLPARKLTQAHRSPHALKPLICDPSKPPTTPQTPATLPLEDPLTTPKARSEHLHKLAFDQVSLASITSTSTRTSTDGSRPSSFMDPLTTRRWCC